jgi:phosphoglycerol transferase MdoB-like AlkP superfamily enzyme
MINATVDEYVNEKQFHIYYLTVSGHMNYSFNGNMMSYKNKDLVVDLPYSDDVKAYIACQIELDKALAQLIKKLEEAGVADRTVIALSADHYPYAWDKSIIDEAAGHSVEPNFEMYKNNFILWSEGMKEKVVIDEPCSSLDILPTLSNLFGLEYDSRLLMGQDILSDAPPLVILSNRSFITDKVMYNSETGEVTKLTSEELPDNYIVNMNKIVGNKFSISKSILKEDYYRHLFKGNSKQ